MATLLRSKTHNLVELAEATGHFLYHNRDRNIGRMTLRVTPHRQFQIGQLRARSQADRTARLRDQISSGVRIHSPSDDPHAQKLILNNQAISSHFQAQGRAIDSVRSVLNEAHVQIRSAQQLVVHARDIALQARQITDPAAATVFAQEIDGILATMDVIANTRHDSRYLFAGTELQTRPYADVSQQTDYQGVNDSGSIRVAGSTQIKTYYSGEYVFSTGVSGITLVHGTTGAVGGTGTASGHGTGELLVQHTSTAFAGTSGVRVGSSSATGDTIIGAAGTHQLQIVDTSGDGSRGTVSLNGGQPVEFTNGDGDLRITGPHGEVVFVDTTAISPGFSGIVDVTADGTLSLDAGQTVIAINYSQNQTLVDQNGNVRHIDSQGITQSGMDSLQLSGNSDLFETLRSLRDDLLHYADFSATQWSSTVAEHLGALELANAHMLDVVGEQSVDLQTLDRLQDRGDDLQLEAQKLLGQLQGTDFTEAVIQLQEEQNLNEYTLATLAGVFQVSILDFLR